MISRWLNQKPEAIALRRKGKSIKDIEKMLGIPRSTLSGWFKSVLLTKKQQDELNKKRKQALVSARAKAVRWHNAQKSNRLEKVAHIATEVLSGIPKNVTTLELALAFLYLGEGAKTGLRTSLGSSDARIAKFFVQCLKTIYSVPTENIKCYLHLRADQNSEKMKYYWSKELKLPLSNFKKPSFDKRTVGKSTYPQYKGVCSIECGKVEIQRRLMYIADGFCDSVVQDFEARSGG